MSYLEDVRAWQAMAAFLSFIISTFALIWSARNSIRQDRMSRTDGFWFRDVVGPNVLEKVLAFSSELTSRRDLLINLANKKKELRTELDKMRREKQAVTENMICLKLFSEEAYLEACKRMDEIEDKLANCLARVSESNTTSADASRTINDAIAFSRIQVFQLLSGVKKLHEKLK